LKRRNSVIIGGAAVLIIAGAPIVTSWLSEADPDIVFVEGAPRGPIETGFRVSRVVDGDTIHVTRNGQRTKVRLLGIDTPETVHPSEPVQCFGPESSDFATQQLDGRSVVLEFDPNQPRQDRFGRTLAYVWVDGAMFNAAALRDGYAEQYRRDDQHPWAADFAVLETQARDRGLGLWGACPNANASRLP
jgi:micrococcal nuclease